MINLNLAPTQRFSVPQNAQYQYQDWAFSPVSLTEVQSFIGLPAPTPISVVTQIKNYIATLGTGTYRVRAVIGYNSASTDYAVLSGPLAATNGLSLTESNLNQTTVVTFQNLDQVSQGIYTLRLDHIVEQLVSSNWVEVETRVYYLRFNRLDYNDVSVTPLNLYFDHQIGQPLPAGKTVGLYANGAFTVQCGLHITLSGGNIAQQSSAGGIITYTGTDTQDVTVSLLPSIETEGLQTPYYSSIIQISNASGVADIMNVRTLQVLQSGFSLTPLALEFLAVKNTLEATERFLSLTGLGTYNVDSFPYWLQVTPTSGTNSQQILVRPIPSENLLENTYLGSIKITAGNKVFFVQVKHQVFGKYQLGFKEVQLNFTDDRDTISTVNIPEIFGDASRSVSLEIETLSYQYSIALNMTNNAAFKREVVNQKASFFVGQHIKKMMYSIEDLSVIRSNTLSILGIAINSMYSVVRYYNPSTSTITFTVNNDIITATDSQSISTGVLFAKGRRPSRIRDSFGVMDFNNSIIRVTPSGFAMFNAFRLSENKIIKILKNGVLFDSFNPITQAIQVFGLRLSFSQFTPGDVIEVRICEAAFDVASSNNNYEFQKYIIFPEGNNNIHIGWENEHGLLELMQCTGDYTITSGYETFTEKNFVDFLEKQVNFGFDKTVSLSINTGWILKENIDRINSIASSKKAWLYFSSTEAPIAIVPKIKKIVNVESDQPLYAFDLDFTVNPTHEYKDYTF